MGGLPLEGAPGPFRFKTTRLQLVERRVVVTRGGVGARGGSGWIIFLVKFSNTLNPKPLKPLACRVGKFFFVFFLRFVFFLPRKKITTHTKTQKNNKSGNLNSDSFYTILRRFFVWFWEASIPDGFLNVQD